MPIEPRDVDRVMQTITEGIVQGITYVASRIYEWYRKQTAPYYIPPPAVRNYEDQPEATYPEIEQKESEE